MVTFAGVAPPIYDISGAVVKAKGVRKSVDMLRPDHCSTPFHRGHAKNHPVLFVKETE